MPKPPTQKPPPTQRPPARHAIVLTALLWPVCVVGAFLGALIGMITGSVGDNSGGWMALAWAILGSIIGIAGAGGLLGWIWAHVCGRKRWIPTLALLILPGFGGTGILVLLSRVSQSEQDVLRIVGIVAIVAVVTSCTFFIGKRTPLRRPPRSHPAAALQ